MDTIPYKLLNIIATLDVVYIDRRPVTLCILKGVSKRVNLTVKNGDKIINKKRKYNLIDYYMITNEGRYQSPEDICGLAYKVIPAPELIIPVYCSSRGVDWYLPRHSSSYQRYNKMLTHAAITDCCLSVFKAILFRISKRHGWDLTPQFMQAVIKNHRLDVLKYIAEKYQKFPALGNLHECIFACELDITMFIVAVPKTIIYKLTDSHDGKRHLTVDVSRFTVKKEVIEQMIIKYPLLSNDQRYKFCLIIKALIEHDCINEALIIQLVKFTYENTNSVDLLTALLDNYKGEPFKLTFIPDRYESTIYLHYHGRVYFV
ncbi:hypothetical protein E24_00154 [Faustovirus]|nr:hypothetical protein PRJ_Fausto_00140 [Faustovirus]AMN83085.1 hypothetical protein E24_00154 [Faustovirus]AMN84067.1 hypothetical protein D5a_00153 [Faustovirus]AMN85054.1 hypothetical protein E23_00153 [Faustovirus]QBR99053.1 hypothetical protein [Faustovirus mariensis]